MQPFSVCGKMREPGPTDISPWRAHSAVRAQVPCSHILSFLSAQQAVAWPGGCWVAGILSFLSPFRAHHFILGGGNHWWPRHPCLPIWQEIFCFSNSNFNFLFFKCVPSPMATCINKWHITSCSLSKNPRRHLYDLMFTYTAHKIYSVLLVLPTKYYLTISPLLHYFYDQHLFA